MEPPRCGGGGASLSPSPRPQPPSPPPSLTVRPVPRTMTSYSSFMAAAKRRLRGSGRRGLAGPGGCWSWRSGRGGRRAGPGAGRGGRRLFSSGREEKMEAPRPPGRERGGRAGPRRGGGAWAGPPQPPEVEEEGLGAGPRRAPNSSMAGGGGGGWAGRRAETGSHWSPRRRRASPRALIGRLEGGGGGGWRRTMPRAEALRLALGAHARKGGKKPSAAGGLQDRATRSYAVSCRSKPIAFVGC